MKVNGIDILNYTCGEFSAPYRFPPSHKTFSAPMPKKVIYSGRATIVIWDDGTKTVVKCSEEDEYVPEVGFLWALAEKVYGSKSRLEKVMGRWLTDGE